jgi:transposase-like protein
VWGGVLDIANGNTVQTCPKCGCIDSHYRSQSIGGGKCKACAKQFTVFSGTRLHSMKDRNQHDARVSKARSLMSMAFHFIEAMNARTVLLRGPCHLKARRCRCCQIF